MCIVKGILFYLYVQIQFSVAMQWAVRNCNAIVRNVYCSTAAFPVTEQVVQHVIIGCYFRHEQLYKNYFESCWEQINKWSKCEPVDMKIKEWPVLEGLQAECPKICMEEQAAVKYKRWGN